MATSRLFFAQAYIGEGWNPSPWEGATATREDWTKALNDSAQLFHDRLAGTPNDWLRRKVASMDDPQKSLSGWRLLMLMVEHDIHHRSQIDTYAGMMGWPVQQIYGRKAEEVGLQQPPRS
jgi:uncharacterized damage-inducible protein DinB